MLCCCLESLHVGSPMIANCGHYQITPQMMHPTLELWDFFLPCVWLNTLQDRASASEPLCEKHRSWQRRTGYTPSTFWFSAHQIETFETFFANLEQALSKSPTCRNRWLQTLSPFPATLRGKCLQISPSQQAQGIQVDQCIAAIKAHHL